MMICPRNRLSFVSLLALVAASPALAQNRPGEVLVPGGVMPAGTATATPRSPSDTLAINLRILAANPRDVTALTQAGISALGVGDPNAALGFLARAEQLSPANGRVKAALGSVMVMMERPNDAMPFFRQAQALGVPEGVYASDRGLAYDLLGDPRQAQRDYAIALRQGRDAETVRRMALSLGISGNRKEALALLDPLLREQDQGAWRARAFVLALTGDQRNADRIIQQVLPANAVPAMSDFLRRLPGLPLAARAGAVNFGTLPSTGPVYAAAETDNLVRAIPAGMTDSLTREEPIAAPAAALPEQTRRKSRRRPGRDEVAMAAVAPQPVSVAPAPARSEQRTPAEEAAEISRRYDAANRRQGGASGAVPAPVAVASRGRIGPIGPIGAVPEGAVPNLQRADVVSVRPGALPPPSARPMAPAAPATSAVIAARSGPEPDPAPVFEISAARPVPPPAVAAQPRPAVAPVVSAPVAPVPAVASPPANRPVSSVFTVAETAVTTPAPASVFTQPVARPVAAAVAPVLASAPAPVPPIRVAVATPPPASVAPSLSAPVPAVVQPEPVAAPAPAAIVASAPVLTPAPMAALSTAPAAPTPAPPVAVAVVAPASAPAPLPPMAQPAPPAGPPSAMAVAPGFSPGLNVPVQAPAAPAPALSPPAAPVLMGPPAPVDVAATGAPVASAPAETAQLAAVETIPAAAPEAITQALAPEASAAPAAEEGLGGLLDDLAPEEERPAGAVLGDAEFRKARAAAKRKADLEAKEKLAQESEAEAKAKAKKEEEEARKRELAKHPPRIWVQVATGSAKSGLGLTARRVKDQAGDTLARYGAATVPYKATNRILVGPFGSEGEARKTINALSKKGVQATMFTSDQGQEVTKLAGK